LAKKLSKSLKKIQVLYFDKKVGSSSSIDIINYLINKKKLKDVYFIIGSDNLIKFHKWKSWKKIVKLVKLIVFSRKGYDTKSKKSIVAKYLKNKILFINNIPIKISSTKLRKRIKKNH
jgi:nicotinate-nucleotide adenylyltransferase